MPGLPQRNAQFSNAYSTPCSTGSIPANGIWSKHRDDVSFDQLQKFWNGLPAHARQALLKIDKQTLLEQARKNMYCSRCNGLLLEGFSQIIMYGKSLQQEGGTTGHLCRVGVAKNQNDSGLNVKSISCQDDCQDPSVHPWGGLVASRDGILTLLDCFLETRSLRVLQNVFDSARVRERERELLYPDACGGGGRGWISQGVANYGRGHGTRETCALHTARLSCDTLVDFWSALGDETRRSLLRMKEEDFIERLMYRFDSKRFCRDCRRNVIREFKELKELKRMRREPRCTSWFCVADTAFQYEVSDDMVQADWHQSFTDTVGTYHHFEWAIGTAEGKSDILDFEDVGMNGSVQVDGLDLGDLCACYITLRAWKLDGRCTELSVKAHAMKGQPCVHRRVVVGDGYVTITKGESIRRFFEHAEEAEEEEDDDSMDKDGNELDGEGSRPQKHAKSPELAREFLLDAATVIFKEQVEKAFREGTARQNAHSIFVCLALKLLEERVHVACKEIITLEKQTKLLEEEEKEKREEEERKERRRTREREKKLRRKERLKGKERDKEKISEVRQDTMVSSMLNEEFSSSVHDASSNTISSEDSVSETGDNSLGRPLTPDAQEEQSSNEHASLEMEDLEDDNLQHSCSLADGEVSTRDGSNLFIIEQSKSFRRKLRFKKDFQLDPPSKWFDRRRPAIGNDIGALLDESESRLHGGYKTTPTRCINGVNRQPRNNPVKSNIRCSVPKFTEKFSFSNNRTRGRCDFHSCSCSQHSEYQAKDGRNVSATRTGREVKIVNKSESASDVSRPFYRSNKYSNGYYMADNSGMPKNKFIAGNIPPCRDLPHTKKVWEPMDSRKKYPRSNSDSDVTLRSSCFKIDEVEEGRYKRDGIHCQRTDNIFESSGDPCLYEHEGNSVQVSSLNNGDGGEIDTRKEPRNPCIGRDNCQNELDLGVNAPFNLQDASVELGPCPVVSTYSVNGCSDPISTGTSSSDNCSSCLSEGDSSTTSSGTQNAESWSTSDSEDASQQSEGRETSNCAENGHQKWPCDMGHDKPKTNGVESVTSTQSTGFPLTSCVEGAHFQGNPLFQNAHNPENGRITVDMVSQQHRLVPPIFNQGMHLPMIPAPSTMAYYHQSPASWSPAPVNGLMPFPQPNRYLFTSPVGYGLSANQPSHLCMQYNALQPLPNSILNVGQHPAYQPVTRATVVNSKEQLENSKLAVAQEPVSSAAVLRERHGERSVLNGLQPSTRRENGQPGLSKLQSDGKNFSLFHFGGPVATSTGCDLNSASLKEKTVGNFSSNPPAAIMQVDLSAKIETTVEEYSLFASSNGTRFSFF